MSAMTDVMTMGMTTADAVVVVLAIIIGIAAIAVVVGLNRKLGGKIHGALWFFVLGVLSNIVALVWTTFLGHTYTIGGTTFDVHNFFMAVGMCFFAISTYRFLALRELDQRKSEFITTVAHQLRTPLSGMKWTLNMLVKGDLGEFSSEQKQSLVQLAENNERLILLVEKLLSANQLDLAKYQLSLTDTDIVALVADAVKANGMYAKAKNVSINFQHSAQALPLKIDKEKIRTVFENLLDNAIKYSRPGGAILVTLEQEGDILKCKVSDNGIGLPAGEEDQVFSQFFRATNARAVEPDGNGLGLFIVKGIIELHGGEMRFESKENEGSTFYFTLPIKH